MSYNQEKKISSFSEIDSYSFIKQRTEEIKKTIETKGKDYILGVDDEQYIKYLINEYTLEPLSIDFNSEQIDVPTTKKELYEDRLGRGEYMRDVYYFTIKYTFSGSSILFQIKPSTWAMTSAEINVNDYKQTVSFSFKIYQQDPVIFNQKKSEIFQRAFANIGNVNKEAEIWNNRLTDVVVSHFNAIKLKYEQENNFFAAINIKINQDTISVFTAPTIKKKDIPQPTIKDKKFIPDPLMSKEMYDDLLRIVYDSGKSMEKKPALYKGKDEEGLRDQFLFVLETRYEGTTATGETFNRGGKTDIILKDAKDGSNLFIAECKFWHGSVEFLKALSQLLGYLTWRDSKAALIVFVKNKDFTKVIRTIQSEIKMHPNFFKENGKRGESSFSYIFNLPQDNEKHVYTEIIVFHYDQ